MRRKHTFLLTIFPSEEHNPALHGRIEFISNGLSYTFNNMTELQKLLEIGIQAEQICPTALPLRPLPTSHQPRFSGYPGQCEEEV